MEVIYLCDRRACQKCSPECKHTRDITHAKNFELSPVETYVEKTRPVAIFKTKALLSEKDLDRIREKLVTQLVDGVVLCNRLLDVVVVDDGRCNVYNVEITKES